MTKLKYAVVRDRYLNPWDAGNYYGLAFRDDVELYLCGTSEADWEEIVKLYPRAIPFAYKEKYEVMDQEYDILDLPDAHYFFTQYFTYRHPKCVVVAWDNLPGKNTDTESRLALARAWRIFARSNQAAHTLLFHDKVDPEKVFQISGAIDTTVFCPPENDGEREGVLYVGRIVPEKGLHTLIWAMAGIEAPLLIAGVGDAEYTNYLKFQAADFKVNVIWLGPVYSRATLAKFYRTAKMVVLPSEPKFSLDPYSAWLEQFGQVIIEAMASGTPVIGSRSGAIEEVLYGSGVLVNPMGFDELHYYIKAILNDPGYQNLSNEAREIAIKQYSIHKIGQDIMEVIDAVESVSA